MTKYTCSKTKDEILEIIAEEFRKVNKDYDDAMQNDNDKLKERNQGRYVAMFDLLHKLEIYLALKLQGIKRGEHIANNNHEAKANYDDYTILCTFKLCKRKIVTYLHENEKKIKDEKHKINLIMKMIEPEINDVYLRLQNVKKTEERVESKDFNNQSNENAGYVKKTKETSDRMKKLF